MVEIGLTRILELFDQQQQLHNNFVKVKIYYFKFFIL